MKQIKYRNFELTLKNGAKIMVKATGSNKVTEKYAIVLAAHWANHGNKDDNAIKREDIAGIKGIS